MSLLFNLANLHNIFRANQQVWSNSKPLGQLLSGTPLACTMSQESTFSPVTSAIALLYKLQKKKKVHPITGHLISLNLNRSVFAWAGFF